MSAEFFHGQPVMIDYTPVADVSAGDMIALGTKTLVAHTDIPADELGALSYPGGQSVYKVTLDAGRVLALGAAVTVDLALGDTSGAVAFGIAVAAADQTAGDTHVLAMLDN